MRFCLLLMLICTTTSSAQLLAYDWGLKKACENTDGVFKQRDGPHSTTGDTCEFKFKVATRDDDESREFCELYAPWRVRETKRDKVSERSITTCKVEATLTCDNGWWQMFGHCFMMPDKYSVYTRPEAEKLCKTANEKGTIAYLHHKYIVGIWRRYFKGTAQIWVDASETWNQYIQKTNTIDGSALALAFTGKHFDFAVNANSLIRIDPNVKLQVLCQYKPNTNPAEINYLGERYSEIYYPSVPVNNGILVRTASSYTSSSKNFDVCSKVMKPYNFKPVAPFVPDEDVMNQLTLHPSELFHLTRSGAEIAHNKTELERPGGCIDSDLPLIVEHPNKNVAPNVIKNFNEKSECQDMRSSAIVQIDGEAARLAIMSDSRSLPIWCKLGYAPQFVAVDVTEDGFATFTRGNGEVVGHIVVSQKMGYESAKKHCQKLDASVSGINSKEEADKLGALAKAQNLNNVQLWLGGKRRVECKNTPGYVKEPTDKCSRNKVIAWEDNVAQEFFDDWWKNGTDHANPSYWQNGQECLTYVSGNPSWTNEKLPGFLDDVSCGYKLAFFCTKKIKLVEKEVGGWQ